MLIKLEMDFGKKISNGALYFGNDFLITEYDEIVKPLIEGDQDMEVGEVISSEREMSFNFKIIRSTNAYFGSITFLFLTNNYYE